MPNEYDFKDIVDETPEYDFSDVVEEPKKKRTGNITSKGLSFGSETAGEALAKTSKSGFSLAPTKSESSQGKTDNIPITEIKEFEQRIQNPSLFIRNPDGTVSTHRMASASVDGKQIAYPTIVKINGKLEQLNDKQALDFALKNNEFREFKTEKEARSYAEGGYKKGTPLENFKPSGSSNIPTEKIDAMREKLNLLTQRNQNTIQRINAKNTFKTLEPALAEKEQQLGQLAQLVNDPNIPIQEKQKAQQDALVLQQDLQHGMETYNQAIDVHNKSIQADKDYTTKLLTNEKLLREFGDKEYSVGKNFVQSLARNTEEAVSGIAGIFNTLGLSGDTEGGSEYDQEEVRNQTRQNIDKIRQWGNSLVTQQKPEEYKSLFTGKLSPGKLLDISTEAISSTIPTVAAGLLTGGTATGLSGAGMMFNESKDILKQTGLNDEQSEWGALGLSIPLGALESYGVHDIVSVVNKSGVRRMAAAEFAKEIAGKTLTKEQLFNTARKSLGKAIAAEAPTILKTGLKEAGTEASQGTLQELAKQGAQEITGKDEDENQSTQEYLLDQLKQRGNEAFGGLVGGLGLQGVSSGVNAAVNRFTASTYERALEYKDPEHFYDFTTELQNEIQNGIITEEQANEAIANVRAIQEADSKIPSSIRDAEKRTQAVNLIIEKNNLQNDIEGKDESLIGKEQERLIQIDNELKNIAKGEKETTENLSKQETGTGIPDGQTSLPEGGLKEVEPNAIEKINKQESIQPERENRDESGQTTETSRGDSLLSPAQSEKEGIKSLKEQLIKGNKVVLDSKGKVEDIRQNSGASSHLFKDLEEIIGDKEKAADYYFSLKNDQGRFKNEFADWENKIMRDYGRSGNEYTIQRPNKDEIEGHENEYAWSAEKNGKPVIFFNDNLLGRDIPFKQQKQGFIDRYIDPEIEEYKKQGNSKALQKMEEYKKLFEENINSNRDIKLHLIHNEMYGIMNAGKEIVPEDIENNYIRSVKEVMRLDNVKLAKDYYGEPMIYAHSGNEGITKFKKHGEEGYTKNDPLTGQEGIYFSRDIRNQEKYAGFNKGTPAKGKDIYYTFLKVKKPYYMDDLQAQAQYPIKDITNISTEQRKALEKLGYDAIIKSSTERPKEEVVVFNPNQIEVIGSYRKGLIKNPDEIAANPEAGKEGTTTNIQNNESETRKRSEIQSSRESSSEVGSEESSSSSSFDRNQEVRSEENGENGTSGQEEITPKEEGQLPPLSEEQKEKDNEEAQALGWDSSPHAINSINRREKTNYKTWEEIPEDVKKKVSEQRSEQTGIKHAETAKLREEFGMDEYQKTRKKTEELEAEADQKLKKGFNADKLIKKADSGELLTDVEQTIMRKHIAGLADKIEKNPSNELIDQARRAIEASDKIGSELGRSLAARRALENRDETLLNYFVQEMEATQVGELTEEQKSKVQKEYEEIKAAKEELERKIADLLDEQNRQKTKQKISGIKKGKRTHEEYVAERKQIASNIRDKLREMRKTTQVTILPFQTSAAELIAISPDVAKMVRSYVEEGIDKLDDIVKGIHQTLKEELPELTEKEVLAVIAGEYSEKTKTRNETTKRLYELKREAKLIDKLEKLEAGEEPKTERKKIERNKELEALRKQIKEHTKLPDYKKRIQSQIEKLEYDLANNNVSEAPAKPVLKLDKEAIKLKDKYIRLKQERELRLLKQKYAMRSKFQKAFDAVVEVTNVPRTIMSSMDFSAPLRQAVVATTSHPVTASKAFVEMFKQAISQKKFDRWFSDVREDYRFPVAQESGLYIADPHDPRLSAKEEAFMNNLAERIPIVGKLIRGSERAYVSYLNKMRWDLFNQMTEAFEAEGRTIYNSPDLYKGAASYINNATGRGKFSGMFQGLEGAAPLLNSVFFSPRLVASRLNFLNPMYYAKLPKEVRVQALKDVAKFIGIGMSVLALAAANGADVEDDPRSTDFGKIKVGNTRWDIWGGYQQYIRVLAQILTGQTKSAMTGELSDLTGQGKFGRTRGDVLLSFIRGKLAPVPAIGADILAGRTVTGEPTTVLEEAKSHLAPLILGDVREAMKDQGVKALFTAGVPATFGVGVSAYKNKHDKYMVGEEEFPMSIKGRAIMDQLKEHTKKENEEKKKEKDAEQAQDDIDNKVTQAEKDLRETVKKSGDKIGIIISELEKQPDREKAFERWHDIGIIPDDLYEALEIENGQIKLQ